MHKQHETATVSLHIAWLPLPCLLRPQSYLPLAYYYYYYYYYYY